MRRSNSLISIFIAAVVALSLGFLAACGDTSTDSDPLSRDGSALEEQAADAVDSDGYCERAKKAKKAPKNNKKVMICHIPPGNPANAHTIIVSKNAVRAHLAHGDVLGACGCSEDDDPGNGNPGNGNGNPGGGDDDDDDDDDDDHGDGDGDDDYGYTPDGTPSGGDGSTDDGGGSTADGTPTGGSGSTGDGTTVDGTPTGGSGSTGDGSTVDGTPVDGSGSTGGGTTIPAGGVCDADQVPCGSSNECGFNAICDMNCCVWVLL